MPFVSSLPDNAVAPHVWARHQGAYNAWPDIAALVMSSESELSMGEKELVGAYSSALRGCTHCYTAHYPAAIAFGINEELFADIMQDPSKAPVDVKVRALLVFIRALNNRESVLCQADFDAFTSAGWSERAASDAIKISALFEHMNVMMMGHGADAEDLSALGPIITITRTQGKYGHGEDTGRSKPLSVIKQSIREHGFIKTFKAMRRAWQFGMIGPNAVQNKVRK